MGNVVISPNLKKTSERIDALGNVINPRTKQVITPVEPEYVPPAPVEKKPEPTSVSPETKPVNPLGEIIKKQVQEQVAKTLKEIDIASMVKQAVEEAFK